MSRLSSELHRLFHTDAPGHTRTLLLEVRAPADWLALGAVWRGVQAELALPAPGIAVSGTDGLQLWFSLQQPASTARAADFLARLQARFLPDMAPARVRLGAEGGLPPVPAQDAASGNWSAFVAPDLAPVFVDTPWLDIPPGDEGQADLLGRLASIPPAAFDAAMQALQPAERQVTTAEAPPAAADDEPRAFLLRVMRDERIELSLRIQAAQALLR